MSQQNLVNDITKILVPLCEEPGGWWHYSYLELEGIAAKIIKRVQDDEAETAPKLTKSKNRASKVMGRPILPLAFHRFWR